MTDSRLSRRAFLQGCSTAAAAGVLTPYFFTADAAEQDLPRSANDRFRIGSIGMRYQGSVVAEKTLPHGDIVAICDVDREIAEKAREQFGGRADLYEDYRKLLDRKDVEIITIGAPDHWHAAMVIDACRAGKDVYVEKPLTLTVDEGKLLCKVIAARRAACSRSARGSGATTASGWPVEMVRQGRIGDLQRGRGRAGQERHGRPVRRRSPAAAPELGPLAGPDARGALHQGALPLHVPLVVRILGRPDDRLGRPPHGHRPVGHRRPAARSNRGQGQDARRAQRLQRGDRLRGPSTCIRAA
jgi:hypothetical protein